MNAPASRQRRTVEERREQLLDLGLELFSSRTYEEISIDEIAQAAGISKGLLYHYFASKRAFYVAAVEKASEQLLTATEITRVHTGEVPPFVELVAGMRTFLEYVEERAAAYVFLLRGGMGGDAEVRDIIERTRHRFADRILEGIGSDPSPRVRIAVHGWIGFIESASVEWLARRDFDRDELAAFLVETFLAVLRTSAAIP
jgi:AcrR family transcriptional regulator